MRVGQWVSKSVDQGEGLEKLSLVISLPFIINN